MQTTRRSSATIRIIAEAGVLMALGTVISLLIFFQMPQGGTVTIGAMLPLILFAYRRGPAWGFGAAICFGLIQGLIGGVAALTLPSLLLDYLVAYGVMGAAGFFRGNRKVWGLPVAALTAGLLRAIVHILSGVVLWYEYAPEGQNVWLYSTGYNMSYMGPEILITVALAVLLSVSLRRFLVVGEQKNVTA